MNSVIPHNVLASEYSRIAIRLFSFNKIFLFKHNKNRFLFIINLAFNNFNGFYLYVLRFKHFGTVVLLVDHL